MIGEQSIPQTNDYHDLSSHNEPRKDVMHRPTPPPLNLRSAPHIPTVRTVDDLPNMNKLQINANLPIHPRALTQTDKFFPLNSKYLPKRNSLNSAESLDSSDEETLATPKELPLSDAMKRRQQEWADRGAAKIVKDVRDPVTGKSTKQVIRKGIHDFKFGETLGDGSYSTVLLATSIDSGKKYAVKVLSKEYLIKQKKVKYVNIEKNTLQRLSNTRGIISLYFTFQDESSLYFLLEYAPNGDLLSLMRKFGSVNEQCTKYYSAQIVDALSFMHERGVIHRDLKPENILLDKDMKIKLTDFGTAKLLESKGEGDKEFDLLTRSSSFVGTAEYVSPELLNDSYVDYKCDIWAFGCILFQMIAGKPPFKANNEYLTFQKVMKVQFAFTAGFPLVVRDLLKNILIKSPDKRLTTSQIKAHVFYEQLNFEDGSVWENIPPELGPYKVTAKALQNPPSRAPPSSPVFVGSSPSHSVSNIPSSKPPNNNAVISDEIKISSETASAPTPRAREMDPRTQKILENAKREIQQRHQKRAALLSGQGSQLPTAPSDTNLNPATAAVAALYSHKSNSSATRHSSSSSAGSGRPHRKPTSSSTKNNSSPSSPKIPFPTDRSADSPTDSVPMSKMDIFWSYHLTNIQEHVLKMGELKMAKTKSHQLESKIARLKLIILDADGRNPKKSTLLTQVARAGGTYTGFRQDLDDMNESDYYKQFAVDESNIEWSFRRTSEEHPGESISKIKHFFIKNNENSAELLHANDFVRRMCVVTSFGRLLIFARRTKLHPDSELFYDLEFEINVAQRGMQLRQILTGEKDAVTKSVFIIQTPFDTFVFQCDDGETALWMKSLVLAIKKRNEKLLPKEHSDTCCNPIANKAALIAEREADIDLKTLNRKSSGNSMPRRSSFTTQSQKRGKHIKNVIRPSPGGSRLLARSEQFLRNNK